MVTVDMASRSAMPNWNAENMRLLTVLEPAMKAPSAPVTPAKNGQTLPTFPATHSAMARGMASCPAAFTSELM